MSSVDGVVVIVTTVVDKVRRYEHDADKAVDARWPEGTTAAAVTSSKDAD